MKRRLVCAVVVLAATGCSGSATSGAAGFASGAGVLGCAEAVVWGTVSDTRATGSGLSVTVNVEEWVVPQGGGSRLTFLAKDPAREGGAPSWQGLGRVLVIVSTVGPPMFAVGATARRMVSDWTEAGSPRLTPGRCKAA